MKISIIGSGALGKTYGGLLSLAGNDVHFLMRSEYDEIREKGFFEINFSKEEKKFKKLIMQHIEKDENCSKL